VEHFSEVLRCFVLLGVLDLLVIFSGDFAVIFGFNESFDVGLD